MDIRANIKPYIDRLPFILVILNSVWFFVFWVFPETWEKYTLLFEHFFQSAAPLIFVLYLVGEKWGFVAKRSVLCLFTLWVSNLCLLLFQLFYPEAFLNIYLYIKIYFSLLFLTYFGIILTKTLQCGTKY